MTYTLNSSSSEPNLPEPNSLELNQRVVATFLKQQVAEEALGALQKAGFPQENLTLSAQTPPMSETEAQNSGGKGAIVGTIAGGLVGLIFSYAKVFLVEGSVNPTSDTIGIVLAASLVGAIGMSLIAAMSGVNVLKDQAGVETSALESVFLVSVTASQPEDLTKAKEILEQYGSQIQQ